MITSIFERNETLRVASCCRNYSLLAYNGTFGVFIQDEDVPGVYRNLKIFVKRAPCSHEILLEPG